MSIRKPKEAYSNFEAHVEVSERLVTGQNPASAEGVGRELAALLQKEQAAA